MAPAVADRIVTADELLEHPEWGRCELVAGKVVFMSPAGAWHGEIAGEIFAAIPAHAKAHNLGKAYTAEAGFLVTRDPDTVRAPDAMFLSKARVPAGGSPDGYLLIPPDLAVEVVSPTDSFSDVTAKAESYIAAGTRLVWVVDPKTLRAYVYRLGRDVRSLDQSQSLEGEDVLPGFALKLADIFRK